MIPAIHDNDKPLYEQIYEFYKEAILQMQMKHHQRLPSYRVLAKELGVSNNTVLRAFEQLIMEGYVSNVERKGLYVTKIEMTGWQAGPIRGKKGEEKTKRTNKRNAGFSPSVYMVDEEHFPLNHWRKCSNRALDSMSFQYQEHEADDPLKDQLVTYLYQHRGVRAAPERIIIGSGATHLVFWLAFILKNSCSTIVVEEPGYTRPRLLFSEFGYNVTPVRVGENGIDIQALVRKKTDLVYLTPSHQYPTGAVMPVKQRIQILNWAKKNNIYIIEDDFDCEFRYKTNLMPSLQGLDHNDRVIYLGSFSNSLMPSLRVAYLVLPENFSAPFQSLAFLTATVPYFIRKTLAIFMEEGYWERHLKKMRNLYRKKYEACLDALAKIPKSLVDFNPAPSGLHMLLRINTKLTEEELIKRALNNKILLTPAAQFYNEKQSHSPLPEVLFEFGSVPLDKIEKLIEALFRVWFPRKSLLKNTFD